MPNTEVFPKWMPSPASRDKLFRDSGFHQGKLLKTLRLIKTPTNPKGLESTELLQESLTTHRAGLTAERWMQAEEEPVIGRALSLEEWGDVAMVLGADVVDILRWLEVSEFFGEFETIGECIKFERQKKGLTQRELARLVGPDWSQPQISALEKVKQRTTLDKLERVAAALNVHVARLVPARLRHTLRLLSLQAHDVGSPQNIFNRRKLCREENPGIEWNDMTTDLLDMLGY